MGRGRGATPRSARPRAGVDGSAAPRFLGFLRNPAESQRRAAVTPALAHHGGGAAARIPQHALLFVFGAARGVLARGGLGVGARALALPQAAAPAASRPISIFTGALSSAPITRESSRFRALRQSQARFRDLWTAGGPSARRHPPKKRIKGVQGFPRLTPDAGKN